MVEIPDSLECLYSAPVEVRDGAYAVDVPTPEVEQGKLETGETYRVAIFTQSTDSLQTEAQSSARESMSSNGEYVEGPPVAEGEVRSVTIETVGEQGDGIAKVAHGYVVIVPDATPGQQPTVEIERVQENLAFARIVDDAEHPE